MQATLSQRDHDVMLGQKVDTDSVRNSTRHKNKRKGKSLQCLDFLISFQALASKRQSTGQIDSVVSADSVRRDVSKIMSEQVQKIILLTSLISCRRNFASTESGNFRLYTFTGQQPGRC